MKHFDVAQWADFLRGSGPDHDLREMQQHLTVCGRCKREVSRLRQFMTTVTADAAYDVPRYAEQNAKSIFVLQAPGKVALSRVVAKLVFDSFRQQPSPGFRAAQQCLTRQALYEAADYCVDVRLEREPDSPMVTLVGQVADRRNPSAALANVPVVLFAGKKVIARAVSNACGEFQMQYRHRGSLRLHLPIEQRGNEIEVSLTSADETRG